jgi:hypothetical protein
MSSECCESRCDSHLTDQGVHRKRYGLAKRILQDRARKSLLSLRQMWFSRQISQWQRRCHGWVSWDWSPWDWSSLAGRRLRPGLAQSTKKLSQAVDASIILFLVSRFPNHSCCERGSNGVGAGQTPVLEFMPGRESRSHARRGKSNLSPPFFFLFFFTLKKNRQKQARIGSCKWGIRSKRTTILDGVDKRRGNAWVGGEL